MIESSTDNSQNKWHLFFKLPYIHTLVGKEIANKFFIGLTERELTFSGKVVL